MITSGGNRNPAKLDLKAGTRRQRRRVDKACLILLSTDATAPLRGLELMDSPMDKIHTGLHDRGSPRVCQSSWPADRPREHGRAGQPKDGGADGERTHRRGEVRTASNRFDDYYYAVKAIDRIGQRWRFLRGRAAIASPRLLSARIFWRLLSSSWSGWCCWSGRGGRPAPFRSPRSGL